MAILKRSSAGLKLQRRPPLYRHVGSGHFSGKCGPGTFVIVVELEPRAIKK